MKMSKKKALPKPSAQAQLGVDMPYLFALLVAANVALFGYFWVNPASDTGTLTTVQSELVAPINHLNNSQQIPPLIGQK